MSGLFPDPKPFTDADGYAVVDEILEYFDSYKIGLIAPIASIIRRERDAATTVEIERLRSSVHALRDTLQCIANEQGDTVLGRRCIAAIGKSRVPPSLQTQSKWQDISTAPRDGSQFLALVSNGWKLIASSPHRMKRGAYYTWWAGGDLRNFPIVDTFPEGYDFSETELLVKWMPLPEGEA